MDNDLVLYTHPISRGRIARWMMEELGQPYRAEIVGFGDEMKSEAYRRVNPMGKVPAVVHNGTIVTEAAAICAYLADAFPQAGLAPDVASPARAPYYRWLFFAAGPLEAAVSDKALGVEVPADKEAMVGYGKITDVLDTLEQAVSAGPYLAGGRFSAADLYVGSHLMWGLQFGTIEKRQAFVDYTGRLGERPAHGRAEEIDNGLIEKMKAAD